MVSEVELNVIFDQYIYGAIKLGLHFGIVYFFLYDSFSKIIFSRKEYRPNQAIAWIHFLELF